MAQALLETGLAYEALLPRTRDEFQQQGGGLEEVVHELYGAFESRRRRHLTLVSPAGAWGTKCLPRARAPPAAPPRATGVLQQAVALPISERRSHCEAGIGPHAPVAFY